jgi:hypothetical protein
MNKLKSVDIIVYIKYICTWLEKMFKQRQTETSNFLPLSSFFRKMYVYNFLIH